MSRLTVANVFSFFGQFDPDLLFGSCMHIWHYNCTVSAYKVDLPQLLNWNQIANNLESNCHSNVYTMTSCYQVVIMHRMITQKSICFSTGFPKCLEWPKVPCNLTWGRGCFGLLGGRWVSRYPVILYLFIHFFQQHGCIFLAKNENPNPLQFCLLSRVFPLQFFINKFSFLTMLSKTHPNVLGMST